MAWRFHPSKFKNTSPKTPKKEDTIFDVPVGTLSSGNNGIHCSSTLIAFNLDGEGGKLGVLPIDARGRRQRKDMTVLCAHAEPLSDFALFPFDPNVIATCCRDEKLKLWRVDRPLDCVSTGEADSVIDVGRDLYLECLAPHRTANNLLGVAYDTRVGVVDVMTQETAFEAKLSLDEHINSIAWSYDGKLLAALGDKGRHGAIVDPRSNNALVESLSVHSGMGRECRVTFAGNEKIVTSGFTNSRTQEIRVFDSRNWKEPEFVQEYSPSTGCLIPLYDDDTKLLFLAGKGTNKLIITEIQSKSPIVSPVFEYIMHDQFAGACLGSKLKMDVMKGEVVRFFQLAKNSINPVPCIVPRRSYRDFHADLFPETIGPFAGCDAQEWISGSDTQPLRVSLDPARKGELIATMKRAPQRKVDEMNANIGGESWQAANSGPEAEDLKTANSTNGNVATAATISSAQEHVNGEVSEENGKSNVVDEEMPLKPEESISMAKPEPMTGIEPTSKPAESRPKPETVAIPTEPSPAIRFRAALEGGGGASNGRGLSVTSRSSRVMSIVGVTSKYRHVETVPGGQHGTFSNVRSVNTRMPTESNALCVSNKYAAIPLSGPAGIVSVVGLDEIKKLPDGVVDGVQNRTLLTDLIWNPFDETRLACALDSGTVNVWTIEEDSGKMLSELEPSGVYKVSHDKIVAIRYNPCALDVLAVASQDHTLSVWNLESNQCGWISHPHGANSSLAIAWSYDGRSLVSVGRDLVMVVYEPQRGEGEAAMVVKKQVLESPKAARVVFACNDAVIVLVHFTRSSSRVVTLLDSRTLDQLHSVTLDTSSQPLVPHFDFDSNVLTLTGKGDRTVNMYEVSPTSPYLLSMASASFATGHQSISLHHKNSCDVRAVEFQRGWRLTEKTLEKLSFRVPRVKKELFQNDIFPPALATWIPAMSAVDWFAGKNQPPLFVDLCPEGMQQYIPNAPQPPARASANVQNEEPSSGKLNGSTEKPQERQPEHNPVSGGLIHDPENDLNQDPGQVKIENGSGSGLGQNQDQDEGKNGTGSGFDEGKAHTGSGIGAGQDLAQTGSKPGQDKGHTGSKTGQDKGHTGSKPGQDKGQTGSGFGFGSNQAPTDINSIADAMREVTREDRKLVEMSWSERIGVDLTLEQDTMQGVAEEEWTDDI